MNISTRILCAAVLAITVAAPSIESATLLPATKIYVGGIENNLQFYEYNVASDTWATRTSPPVGSVSNITSDASSVFMIGNDNNIYSYDPAGDSWSLLMAAPAPLAGSNSLMFEEANGEFYAARTNTTTLYYTVSGVWNNITAPNPISTASSFDAATGELAIRIYGKYGGMIFDTATASFNTPCVVGSNGEHDRVGSYFGGMLYASDGNGQALFEVDPVSCVVNPLAPVALAEPYMSSDVDGTGLMYIAHGVGADATGRFDVYDTAAGTMTALAANPGNGIRMTTTAVVPANGTVVTPPGPVPDDDPVCGNLIPLGGQHAAWAVAIVPLMLLGMWLARRSRT